jgi:hypothetical protein
MKNRFSILVLSVAVISGPTVAGFWLADGMRSDRPVVVGTCQGCRAELSQCSSCGSRVTRIKYEIKFTAFGPIGPQVLPDGRQCWWELTLCSNRCKVIHGGYPWSAQSPGWLCETCGRTWLIPLEEVPKGPSFLERLREYISLIF